MPETALHVTTGASASWRDADVLRITLTNGDKIAIPRNEVLTVHGFCDGFLRHVGAWDTHGRAVVYPPDAKP